MGTVTQPLNIEVGTVIISQPQSFVIEFFLHWHVLKANPYCLSYNIWLQLNYYKLNDSAVSDCIQ